MAGNGAAASAGYHDKSGCIDTRTHDSTATQREKLIRSARTVGWAVWKRDAAHGGMDEHMHFVTYLDTRSTYFPRRLVSKAGGPEIGERVPCRECRANGWLE